MTTQQYDRLVVTDLVDWIEKHIDDKLLIDDVSRQSGYSKWHIQRKFKAVTGKTIASYIRNRKLTRAALALRKTDRRVWISRSLAVLTTSRHLLGCSVRDLVSLREDTVCKAVRLNMVSA